MTFLMRESSVKTVLTAMRSLLAADVLHGMAASVLEIIVRGSRWAVRPGQRQGCLFEDDRRGEPVLVRRAFGNPLRGTAGGRRSERNSSSGSESGTSFSRYAGATGRMPTPRTSETLGGTGAQVLDEGLRI